MLLNRFMAPVLDAGLGRWMGTPIGGYILLLKVRGRRSGRTVRVPLSYLILDGAAWVMAGYGVRTQWYRNLIADPGVTVVLPGRALAARAEEVLDPSVRARVLPRLTRAAGLPGFLVGCNPWTASDERLLGLLDWIPLIRVTPVDGPLEAGPDDPGGRAWIRRQAMIVAITCEILLAVLWRRRRH